MSKRAIRILWAEDSISDILLIKDAFEQAGLGHNLNVFEDGVEATDFLFHRGRYAHAMLPELIILDLNMPRKNGREVIEDIKTDPALMQIPLVVLTSSRDDIDVLHGLDPKRCLYLVKPTTFQNLVEMAKQINDFWLSLANPDQKP
jgi:two-component system, chemotaxis family, response regulator Rcp1